MTPDFMTQSFCMLIFDHISFHCPPLHIHLSLIPTLRSVCLLSILLCLRCLITFAVNSRASTRFVLYKLNSCAFEEGISYKVKTVSQYQFLFTFQILHSKYTFLSTSCSLSHVYSAVSMFMPLNPQSKDIYFDNVIESRITSYNQNTIYLLRPFALHKPNICTYYTTIRSNHTLRLNTTWST